MIAAPVETDRTSVRLTPGARLRLEQRLRRALTSYRGLHAHFADECVSRLRARAPAGAALLRASGMARRAQEIEAALQRLAEGTFGRCGACGFAIPLEQLIARPERVSCRPCFPVAN